ncbi:proline-rich early nodulin-like protein [Grosmannia clavigera kw1407]|uniref:Proline-rich early nodulin-like protein n=1 Tax=Grosmannia clavigera (strain kw1407 / UAMH 11150) TaxID=655863 RepID=F0XFT5_GROCL|nr:proline-rich early nodulin-like protein [Grosmannia clavigera kw1407]EFX04736.1 proline-rich early nodulin-like protein [Grosmannia clavigera kw1407]
MRGRGQMLKKKMSSTEEAMASTPQVAITRSGRKVTQKRLAPIAIETRPIKGSPSETAVVKRRKREAAKWQTDFVLSSAKSPLGNYDIRALLCNPKAWEVLSKEEQAEVLSLFPSNQHIIDPDSDQARPDIASLRNDDNFRHDCARYQTDLQGGFHDKAWLAEAFEAYEMRKNGHFENYIIDTFESDWNIRLPDEHKPDYMRVAAGSDVEAEQPNDSLSERTDPIGTADAKENGANGEMKDIQSDTGKNGAVKVENGMESEVYQKDETEKDDTEETYVHSEFVVMALTPDIVARESGSTATEAGKVC